MKKILTVLLSLALWAAMLMPANATAGDATLVSPTGQETFYTMAAMGDTLYLMAESGLYSWKAGDAAPVFLGKPNGKQDAETQVNSVVSFGSPDGSVIRIGGYFIDHLLSDGEKLYGLDSDDGTLYLLTAANGVVTCDIAQSLAWESMVQNQGGITIPGMVASPMIADGYLYLIKYDFNISANEVLRYSLSDGSVFKYDAALITALAPYQANKALVLMYTSQQDAQSRTGKQWLNILDLDTGAVQKGLELPVTKAQGLAYDMITDTAAFFSSGEVYAVDQMAACRLAGYAPGTNQGFISARAQMLGSNLYVLAGDHMSIRNVAQGNGLPRALRIQNAMELTYKEFAVKRPDIPVVLLDTTFDSAETLMQDMAGGGSDLYSLQIDVLDYTSLLSKGYTASLNQSELLKEHVAQMYPFLQKVLMRDGSLAAFPVSLSGRMPGVSKMAMEELGIKKEDLPQTFEAWMEFITHWDENYGIDHPSIKLFEGEMYGDPKEMFFGWMLESYSAYYQKQGANLTFDTPLMESLLLALDAVDFSALETNDVQQAISQSGGTVTYSVFGADTQQATALFTMYHDAVLSEYGFLDNEFEPLPIALADGMEPVIPVSMTVYIINPYSVNQDLAIAYLEHFAAQRSVVSRTALSDQYNEPVQSARYETGKDNRETEIASIKAQLDTASEDQKKDLNEALKQAEADLSYLESIRWQLGSDQIAAYRQRVGYMAVSSINPITLLAQDQSMQALLGRYAAGQLTYAQLLEALEQKLQMLYKEGGM